MTHILSNGVLTVEIADVGAYGGTRFDWTGFITSVKLEQGGHTFAFRKVWCPGRVREG